MNAEVASGVIRSPVLIARGRRSSPAYRIPAPWLPGRSSPQDAHLRPLLRRLRSRRRSCSCRLRLLRPWLRLRLRLRLQLRLRLRLRCFRPLRPTDRERERESRPIWWPVSRMRARKQLGSLAPGAFLCRGALRTAQTAPDHRE